MNGFHFLSVRDIREKMMDEQNKQEIIEICEKFLVIIKKFIDRKIDDITDEDKSYLLKNQSKLQNAITSLKFNVKAEALGIIFKSHFFTKLYSMDTTIVAIDKIYYDLMNFKEYLENLDLYNISKGISGSLSELESCLIEAIYDFVLKNPKYLISNNRQIPDRIKKQVKQNDKNICQICLELYMEGELEIDHIYPYSLGGSNQIINLMALCRKCNREKSGRLDFYKTDIGKAKIKENIALFTKNVPMIANFAEWLSDNATKPSKKSNQKKKSKR